MGRSVAVDDLVGLRLRQGTRRWPDSGLDHGGLPAFVGRVRSDRSKIAVNKFLLVQPVSVLGVEKEGGVGDLSSLRAAPVPVYLLGPGLPDPGDYLICRFVDHRWVAEKAGRSGTTSGYIPVPQCFCLVPPTLRMTSADPKANYRMFQSCTIQYQTPPAEFTALGFTQKIFLSTSTFDDPIAKVPFYYLLSCLYNQFTLTRLYPTSPYGSPYRDAALYTWLVGGYGNSCDPFRLDNGSAFPGSDPTCSVTIDPA